MKVIVVGAGRLGRQFASVLAGAGNVVTVIDRNPAVATQANVDVVTGDGCEPTVLEAAGAYAADLLVAATGEDEDNLVVSLLARRQFGVDRIVARVNDADNAWLFDERWGVDIAVPSAAPLISIIEEATGAADTVSLLSLGRAGISLVETVIGSDWTAVGRPLSSLPLPPGYLVATVVRDGQPVVPAPSLVLEVGDEVIVVAPHANEEDVRAAFR
jgi:trk system potassium uptake protein TrkA